jgi:hypothetical protein
MSYFKVEEECILQSKAYPELNGDCVVKAIFGPRLARINYPDGTSIARVGFGYTTTIKTPSGLEWDESALRKKHKPSTESLSTMIEELNKVKA